MTACNPYYFVFPVNLPVNATEVHTLRGYRCIGDVTFDLDGTLATDLGWVLFEVSDEQPDRARGVVGTFNNYATLQLIRSRLTKAPCRIYGLFDDGKTGVSEWHLDDVFFTSALLRDVTGLIGFRASATYKIK